MLLHTADAGAALPVGDVRHLHPADGHRARFRRVQAQQQPEHRALARAGAAHQRDLLALLHGHGKVLKDVLFAVAEGDMVQHHVTPGRRGPCGRLLPLRLGEKGVDALHARHSRLDGLDLHAKALDGFKDAGDVVDHGHRGAHRHAEQREHRGIARGRQQHDRAHHDGVQHQHHR